MFGSFTRLTDSGLGCPDWPGCYGHSNPLSADEPIRAAETALPSGPVTMTKAWIEMVHRYFAMGVGLLIIILAVQSWTRWRREGGRSPWLATGALAWVIGQGAFGALTVTMKLQPVIVTIHLLGGVGLLALLVWLALREGEVVHVAGPGLRGAAGGARAGGRGAADRARRLGQHQLRGHGVPGLSVVPGAIGADHGLRARVHALARRSA